MKHRLRTIFRIVFLAFGVLFSWILIYFVIFPKTLIRYKCPSFSGIVLDDYTGRPIEGAKVRVSWGALRGRWPEGSDLMDLHTVTVATDRNGVYTIPAWESEAAREWVYYEFNPNISVANPKEKPNPQIEEIQRGLNQIHDESTFSANSHGFALQTINLKPPEWAISEEEIRVRENPVAVPEITEEVSSNSLTYFIVWNKMVENGRPIDTVDFPKIGYIRPKPDLVITRIQSYTTNVAKDFLYMNWHVIGMPDDQPFASGFSITLFQEDAKKIAELERKQIRSRNLLFMLGDKPLAETYMATDAGSADSIPIPIGPQTIYLPLRNHQNIQEINDALKKLVRP